MTFEGLNADELRDAIDYARTHGWRADGPRRAPVTGRRIEQGVSIAREGVVIDLNRAHVFDGNGIQLSPGVVRGIPGVDMLASPPTLIIQPEAFRRIAAQLG